MDDAFTILLPLVLCDYSHAVSGRLLLPPAKSGLDPAVLQLSKEVRQLGRKRLGRRKMRVDSRLVNFCIIKWHGIVAASSPLYRPWVFLQAFLELLNRTCGGQDVLMQRQHQKKAKGHKAGHRRSQVADTYIHIYIPCMLIMVCVG